MGDYELGAIQTEFAELIWEREPVSSGELVKLCSEQFEWKKSTTYTVLRKLCEKGIMKMRTAWSLLLCPGKLLCCKERTVRGRDISGFPSGIYRSVCFRKEAVEKRNG